MRLLKIKHIAETVEKVMKKHWIRQKKININIKKINIHQSVVKIKSKYLKQGKFSFQPVSVKDAEKIIKNISSNKAPISDIPIQKLKLSGFTFQIWTDCINDAINLGVFPDSW